MPNTSSLKVVAILLFHTCRVQKNFFLLCAAKSFALSFSFGQDCFSGCFDEMSKIQLVVYYQCCVLIG